MSVQTIPYTLQWSEYKTVGRKKRWCEKYEQVFVEVNDAVAAFLERDDGREQRYQWKVKKQKQDAKIFYEFSLDEMVQPSDGTGEEFPVEEIIADKVHPDNRDPLEIMLEKEALARLNKIAAIRDKIYASTQPLSGIMYCADCGGKMRLGWNNTRHRRIDGRIYLRENYNCGNYSRFGKFCCFSHYIKLKTINALVLMDIRSKAALVMGNEKLAREDFLRRKDKLSEAEQAIDRNRLKKGRSRLSDLDRMITSVYEDKVLGKIPEEVCVNLLNKYLDEKNTLKADVETLERKISEVRKGETDVNEFIKRIKGYVDVQELTREICLELIEYITVDGFPHDDKKKTREIHIYYKLIDRKKTPNLKEQTA